MMLHRMENKHECYNRDQKRGEALRREHCDQNLSLDIKESEFFTLLGPSGCGKTTLLRMIAGFNSIEGGDFFFGDRRVNDMDPAKRNVGMVFQNYAIFPNMTVRENVEFGLKNRKIDKSSAKRKPKNFSG